MTKTGCRLLLCLSVALAGCSSAPITRLKLPDPSSQAEVLIFRDPAHTAGFVTVAFGANKQALVKLEESEFASISLNPGSYDLFVQARTADPTVITTTLRVGDRKCLMTVADNENFARALVPIVMMTKGYLFSLHEMKCPSDTETAKYSRVRVDYQTH